MNLEVSLGKVTLANPLMTASGCCGYGLELEAFGSLHNWGGIVVKGLSLKPRPGNPGPRIWETPSGMLNAIGLENIGIEAFLQEKLPLLMERGVPIWANLFGETVEEYIALAKRCEEAKGLKGIELNLSCPNVKKGGMAFGLDPESLFQVVKGCREVYSGHLLVKLSPNGGNPIPIAQAAQKAGADGLTCMNTYQALAIDPFTGRPRLWTTYGGLSGPAIKPITLRMVRQIYEVIDIPILGSGGITTGLDVVEYLRAGAKAVQVGTLLFWEPDAVVRLLQELQEILQKLNLPSLNALVGKMEPYEKG